MIPRLASHADIAELVRVINRAYEVEVDMFRGTRTSETDVRDRMARAGSAFLALDDSTPGARAGALIAGVYVELRGTRGYFGMLAVDPAKQGLGLGRTLVRSIEQHCMDAGCEHLDLDVVDLRAELLAFYGALGFTRTVEVPYPDPSQTLRPVRLIGMTKTLR